MKVLLLGASGATGRLVLKQLLDKQIETKIVIRAHSGISESHQNNKLLESIVGNISEFSPDEYSKLVADCDTVISCLGHNISFKGIFGKPRKLVTNCIKNICSAILTTKTDKTKLILMSTTAYRNTQVKENYGVGDRAILSSLYYLLPPHRDNVDAGLYLVNTIGVDKPKIEWVMVRPDGLIDEENESEYKIHQSPNRSPIFDPGKASRINVSGFMIKLLLDEKLWNEWRYNLPVLYNAELKTKEN